MTSDSMLLSCSSNSSTNNSRQLRTLIFAFVSRMDEYETLAVEVEELRIELERYKICKDSAIWRTKTTNRRWCRRAVS